MQNVTSSNRTSSKAINATGPVRPIGDIGLSNFLPYLLNRIASNWDLKLQEKLRKNGLNTVRMRTLAVLTVSNGLSIKELINLTVVEQSTLSRALDALEKQALIERVTAAGDKRVRLIFITDHGRRTFDHFWPGMFRDYEMMLAGVDEQERQALMSTLNKILGNVRSAATQ